MFYLLLMASTPAPTLSDQARRVVEWQLRSPPRSPSSDAGLSAEEAAIIRQNYLQSIGQRPPHNSDEERSAGQ